MRDAGLWLGLVLAVGLLGYIHGSRKSEPVPECETKTALSELGDLVIKDLQPGDRIVCDAGFTKCWNVHVEAPE